MAERGAETQTRVNRGDEVELERLAEAPPQKPACTRRIEVDGGRRRKERERTRLLNDEMVGLAHPGQFMCQLCLSGARLALLFRGHFEPRQKRSAQVDSIPTSFTP
ncbi:hypothetical protein J3458_003522 [Metarhizium acridum]|uniref:uncharacterized protein n=1 Tax=Metarhizium acridum TaxID=92637 RepID=UPI001C6C5BEC|nr:hypothetical protein J3458_003522 [Metarhizium acridum]